ncbi:MAG: hypothetical protein KDC95_01655 [Planctomycetes bacterium]|nr:hypothetical protein [Planctomycetota bacterium]
MSPYEPQATDTDEAVDRFVMDGFARMTPRERLELAMDAYRDVVRLSIAGIARRHPHASMAELERRAGALRLGRELTLAVYGQEAEAWFD